MGNIMTQKTYFISIPLGSQRRWLGMVASATDPMPREHTIGVRGRCVHNVSRIYINKINKVANENCVSVLTHFYKITNCNCMHCLDVVLN